MWLKTGCTALDLSTVDRSDDTRKIHILHLFCILGFLDSYGVSLTNVDFFFVLGSSLALS